ncbi:MAG: SAM-dependent methyltransferase, partial [Moorea sp. SIO2C4]|nr:SAM-dependent methyltransferase [Moorena sp. SIO2C4]
EVQRISKPGGIIAIWGYWYFNLLREEEHLKQMLRDFFTTVFD